MKLKIERMEDSQLCDDERFYDQGHAADCSGFLVGKGPLFTLFKGIQKE
jgi:hypothetical protein